MEEDHTPTDDCILVTAFFKKFGKSWSLLGLQDISMICLHSHAKSNQQLYNERNKDQTQADSRMLTTVGLCTEFQIFNGTSMILRSSLIRGYPYHVCRCLGSAQIRPNSRDLVPGSLSECNIDIEKMHKIARNFFLTLDFSLSWRECG